MTSEAAPSILHVDMDAFFASVEALEQPALRGIPLIVGGTGARGVVASCSYEARFFGVRSAMSSVRARELCPQATFVDGHFDWYRSYSQRMRNVFDRFTPLVEPLSLDEAFLDVTGATQLFGTAVEIGWKIRNAIANELGLWCSVGVASSKHLAKLASKEAKPVATRYGPRDAKAVVCIDDTSAITYLHQLPVRSLWGVGPATERRLAAVGITTVKALAAMPLDALEALVGHAGAMRLNDLAWNRDERVVNPVNQTQSIGHEQTYEHDLTESSDVIAAIHQLSQESGARLRSQGMAARTISLKVRFGDFATTTRSATRTVPTDATRDIFETARSLFRQVDFNSGIRLLGVSVSGLTEVAADVLTEGGEHDSIGLTQPSLFDHQDHVEDHRALDAALDAIAARFGKDTVAFARTVSGTPRPTSPREHESFERDSYRGDG